MHPTLVRTRARRRPGWRHLATGFAAALTTTLVVSGGVADAVVAPTSTISTVSTHPEELQLAYIRYGAGSVYAVGFLDPQGSAIYRLVPGGAPVRVAGVSGEGDGDGGPALDASFEAEDVVVAPDGTIYVADTATHKVRKIGADGTITPFAGNGQPASSGDGGPATAAGMQPVAVALDSTGNLYVSDTSGAAFFGAQVTSRIRKITPAGTVSTFVEFPAPDDEPFSGINPYAGQINVDAADNLWLNMFVTVGGAGVGSNLVKVAPNGTQTTFGDGEIFVGTAATTPDGITYVSDNRQGIDTLVVIPPDDGDWTNLHSNADMGGATPPNDGPVSGAQIDGFSVAVDAQGDLFVLEPTRLRKITNPTPLPAAHTLQPARILDTRPGAEQTGYSGAKPGQGATVSLQVTGRGGVPATGVAAVTMNVTLTESTDAGFITVWPSGVTRPLSSNLNAEGAGATVANLVTVPVGTDGKVNLFTQSGGHLLADVAAWIPAGVYVPKTPTRILDTRPGAEQIGYTGAKPGPGGTVELQVTGVAGVPASGVSAIVFNVTATEATDAGFVTVWPTGQTRPNASSLNLERPGATAPNQVTVPVGAGGKVSFFTQSGAHLLADLAGYYTTSTGYTPLTPARILDTRPGAEQTGYSGAKPGPGATVSVAISGHGGVPATGVGAVVLNVTATEATDAGFISAWPGGTTRPNASVLNLTRPGQTRPNAVLVPVGADGTVNLFTQSGAHLIVDVAGWFPAGT